MNTIYKAQFFFLSPSSSDLVITAAAQVVCQSGIRVGRRWRWCHFLWHAGLVRRLFEHGVQTAVRPVVRGRLQAQQVWDEKEEQSEMYWWGTVCYVDVQKRFRSLLTHENMAGYLNLVFFYIKRKSSPQNKEMFDMWCSKQEGGNIFFPPKYYLLISQKDNFLHSSATTLA